MPEKETTFIVTSTIPANRKENRRTMRFGEVVTLSSAAAGKLVESGHLTPHDGKTPARDLIKAKRDELEAARKAGLEGRQPAGRKVRGRE
jgi:hypothetical protein